MAKKSTFFKDFKDFISKGNIIDMAVGVVIGGAFGAIVTGLVNYIINPVLRLLTGGVSLENVKTVLKAADAATETAEVAIMWGLWIQTIIDFILIALCIFLVLRAIVKAKNAANRKKLEEEKAKEEEEKAKAKKAEEEAAAKQAALEESTLKQAELLAEIRDILKRR